jgi:hypothetical protein
VTLAVAGVVCSVCGVWKPDSEFHQFGGKRHGRQCKKCRSKKQVVRQSADPEYRDNLRTWRATNADKELARSSARRLQEKLSALDAYGGRSCRQCGESSVDTLQLDHVNNDGSQHRSELRAELNVKSTMSGWVFYKILRLRGYPTDPALQVLCDSCHQTKTNSERQK